MTRRRDLKRRVRERQARTGESYTAALKHVLAARPAGDAPEAIDSSRNVSTLANRVDSASGSGGGKPLSVVEMIDLSTFKSVASVDVAAQAGGVDFYRIEE